MEIKSDKLKDLSYKLLELAYQKPL